MFKNAKQISVILLICTLFLGGCVENDTETGENTEKVESYQDTKITVLYSDWPSDLIPYLAQEKGFFAKHKVEVELVKIIGYADLDEAILAAKSPKIWSYTLLDLVGEYGVDENVKAQAIFLEDYSFGADAVLAMEGSGIESMEDLKGKKVGVEIGTVSEFFLYILLDNAQMSVEDIETVYYDSHDIPEALLSGEIDAGVAYEPAIARSVNLGARIIVDSKQMKNTIIDVYMAEKRDLEVYSAEYKRFLAAISDARDYFHENPDEAIKIMAEPFDLDEDELRDSFEGLELPNLSDNQAIFSSLTGPDSIYNVLRKAAEYLRNQGIEVVITDYSKLINAELVISISN